MSLPEVSSSSRSWWTRSVFRPQHGACYRVQWDGQKSNFWLKRSASKCIAWRMSPKLPKVIMTWSASDSEKLRWEAEATAASILFRSACLGCLSKGSRGWSLGSCAESFELIHGVGWNRFDFPLKVWTVAEWVTQWLVALLSFLRCAICLEFWSPWIPWMKTGRPHAFSFWSQPEPQRFCGHDDHAWTSIWSL